MTLAPLTLGSLTAGDLMSREVKTIPAGLPIRDAARELAAGGVRGFPVVDEQGHCVGMLSVTDLARWAARRRASGGPVPKTCAFQEKIREPGGRETVLCLLGEGVCPFQQTAELPGGGTAVVCTEPHCVPTDWQMVETEEPEPHVVRDLMTTSVVTVAPEASIAETARLMLDRGVHRLLVLDPERHPVGVVAVDDLLQILAHPELTPAGASA